MKICVASKKKHAPLWRTMRDNHGNDIISTWIDNIGRTTEQFKTLSVDCLNEAIAADVTILYCKSGENIKGAFFEVGAALSAGKKVFAVTEECSSNRHIFNFHPNWTNFKNLNDALEAAKND
jgi:hypothetical protein